MKKLKKKHFELNLPDWQDYTFCESKKEALEIFRDSMLRHYLPGTLLNDEELMGSIREYDMRFYGASYLKK